MPIRISKHGLTPCPACRTHVRAQGRGAAAACPFCGASLAGAARAPALSGRSAALAAGLLSLGIAACDDDADGGGGADAQPRDAVVQDGTAGDDAAARDAAAPVDASHRDAAVRQDAMPVADAAPTADQGPEPDAGTPADAAPPADLGAPDPDSGMAVPLYGIPPGDFGVSADAEAADAGAQQQDLGAVVPLYGIPPIEDPDAAPPAADAGTSDAAPQEPDFGGGVVPLYGIPPSPDER
ncbi:MAG: hypothetical protein H6704_29275 [Myxococcales bacterium]|nr:hypothetical protein [Myxococcales bacterium]